MPKGFISARLCKRKAKLEFSVVGFSEKESIFLPKLPAEGTEPPKGATTGGLGRAGGGVAEAPGIAAPPCV